MKRHHIKTIVFYSFMAAFTLLIGYAIMRALVHIFPMGSQADQLLVTILIIGLGLGVPYWMLKTGFYTAHMIDPDEKQLTLENLPKNERELVRSRK